MDVRKAADDVGISPAQRWERAVQAFQRSQPERARQALAPLLAPPVPDGESLFLGGLIEEQAGDWERAATLLEAAVERSPGRAERWLALASVQRMLGRADDAARSCREALRLEPRDAPALNDLAAIHEDLGQYREALACRDEALSVAPDFADALRGRPGLLARLQQPEAARADYEDLVTRWPEDVSLRLEFAEFLERGNRLDEAEAHLAVADAAVDDEAIARREALRARLLVRRDAPQLALDVVASARRRTGADWLCYQEGHLLDRLGRPDEAMRAFQRGNAARSRDWRFARLRDRRLTLELDGKIRSGFDAPGEVGPGSSDRAAPVFLLGLPRSGTTLLDRMLGAHPEIQVLEEPQSLRLLEAALARGASPAEARAAYWEQIEAFQPDGRPVIVDKNPLHAMHLGVLPQVFPDARVIVALRHPYDAALSCFMQDFDPSPASAQFLDLDATGRLCAQLLILVRQYEAAFPARTLRVHYEHLVADFRAEITRVLAALGRQWHDHVDDYAARAGFVTTPSYEQVARDLYGSSVARWRRYRPWIDPLRPSLGPLLADFGYSE